MTKKNHNQKKNKDLESLVADLKIPPKDFPEGIRYKSRFAYMNINFAIKVLGIENYREHSVGWTNRLSKSIKKDKLLEPIIFAYDTSKDKWEFIAGEGRIWSCYQNSADEIPVEIFYDVPEDTIYRMRFGSNSTKTSIDPEDIAFFAKRVSGLLDEYNNATLNKKNNKQVKSQKSKSSSAKQVSEIIYKSTNTVNNYFQFTDLNKQVIDYVNAHREEKLFSRAVKIGKSIENKNHQREFLSEIINIEEKYRKEGLKKYRLNNAEFDSLLKEFVKLKEEEKEGSGLILRQHQSRHKIGDSVIKQVYNITGSANKYIKAFTNLVEYYPEIKETSKTKILEHIIGIHSKYELLLSKLPEELANFVTNYMNQPADKSFREIILEQAERRRIANSKNNESRTKNNNSESKNKANNNLNRVEAIGDEVLFVSTEDIVLPETQLRSRYNDESIEALVKELNEYGQLTPGLLRPIKNSIQKYGSQKYSIVYGHTRFIGVCKAKIPYYKAFVRDLTNLEVSLLQAVEDLSEHDTPAERAKALHNQYLLMKSKTSRENKDYTKNEFVKDFAHLGSKKTLKDALEFMELDIHLRQMVGNNIIAYDSAISIGKLSPEDRLDVLYNAMTEGANKKNIDSRIQKILENNNAEQKSLFNNEGLDAPIDIPKNYSIIVSRLESHALAPFQYINNSLSNSNDKVLERILRTPQIFVQYAELYKNILQLENNLKNK